MSIQKMFGGGLVDWERLDRRAYLKNEASYPEPRLIIILGDEADEGCKN